MPTLPLAFEIGTFVVLGIILLFDLLLVVTRPHEPSMKEASLWVAFYVGLALAFAALMFVFTGPEYGGQFTDEAAQYAIDNVDADWNANALGSAETYSDLMHMSKQGIFDQLTSQFDQYTDEQAQYAIDTIDADWNENALESAKIYQDEMAMSPDAIHDQLTSEYGDQFTQEQADYAIENLNG